MMWSKDKISHQKTQSQISQGPTSMIKSKRFTQEIKRRNRLLRLKSKRWTKKLSSLVRLWTWCLSVSNHLNASWEKWKKNNNVKEVLMSTCSTSWSSQKRKKPYLKRLWIWFSISFKRGIKVQVLMTRRMPGSNQKRVPASQRAS